MDNDQKTQGNPSCASSQASPLLPSTALSAYSPEIGEGVANPQSNVVDINQFRHKRLKSNPPPPPPDKGGFLVSRTCPVCVGTGILQRSYVEDGITHYHQCICGRCAGRGKLFYRLPAGEGA